MGGRRSVRGAVALVAIGAAFAALGIVFVTRAQPGNGVAGHQAQTAQGAKALPTASPTTDSILQAGRAIVAPASPPARLVIPKIGVDAAVESVGLDAQGNMAIPARTDEVAWYKLGAIPGEVGDAVIDGHLDWYNGPAVFWKLGSLRAGDVLTVRRQDGSQKTFKVDSTSLMSWDAPTDSLFTSSGPPTLTLITCAGSWDKQKATYTQRLVVRASLSTDPTNPPAD